MLPTPIPPPLNAERDMLDIIFAQRNRAYGAYALRRNYPEYLGKALLSGLLLIGCALLWPYFLNAVSTILPKPEEVVVVLERPAPPPPPPAEVPPPPPPAPPPPARSSVAFVPPVVLPDPEVPNPDPLPIISELSDSVNIGKVTRAGTYSGEPEPIDPVINDPGLVEPAAAPSDEPLQPFDVQKLPAFPGGDAELMLYLSKNIKIPPLARENGIQGMVVVSFVVGRDGSISDIKTLKDPGGGCGKEVVRVVSEMPRWSPGEANGNPVKVRFTLPVRIRLE